MFNTDIDGECPLDHTPNAVTIAAIEEGRAMLRGEIPANCFNSLEEMLEALENLFGCCANTGDTLDAYMERHWADNDLERSIELGRAQERENSRR
jgi:hypothetical protein